MHAAALRQLAHRNHPACVQAARVNPRLYAIQVHDSDVGAENVFEPALPVHDFERCLPAVEARWHFAVLLLALVSAAGGFAFAAGRAAAAADLFVVCAGVVGERGEDGCGASLMENLELRNNSEPWRGLARREEGWRAEEGLAGMTQSSQW